MPISNQLGGTPAVFISHGSPAVAIEHGDALAAFGRKLRPNAALAVAAPSSSSRAFQYRSISIRSLAIA